MSQPPRLTRRHVFAALACGLSAVSTAATPKTLPVANNLASELEGALTSGRPLLVLVSLEGCGFCRIARENYLAPMRERGELSVVQVDMRSPQRLTDFHGLTLTHDALVRAWGIKVAPTVLFFGRGGAEVAERLVGSSIPDFYGAYLDDRIHTARRAVTK